MRINQLGDGLSCNGFVWTRDVNVSSILAGFHFQDIDEKLAICDTQPQ